MFDTPETIIPLIIVLFAVVGTGFYFSMTPGEHRPFNPQPQTLDDQERESFYRADRKDAIYKDTDRDYYRDDPAPIRETFGPPKGTDMVPTVPTRAWEAAGFGPGGSQAGAMVKLPDRPMMAYIDPIDDGSDPRQLIIHARAFNVSAPIEVVVIAQTIDSERAPFCPLCDNYIWGTDKAMMGIMMDGPDYGNAVLALIHEVCGQRFKPGATVQTAPTHDDITDRDIAEGTEQ